MHREIINPPECLVVDHKDYNGLNNTKNNLRVCTRAQNAHHSRPYRNKLYSNYKGVTFDKRCHKWYAGIVHSSKKIYLGSFDDKLEAAVAYDRKAEQLFGEFVYLNFPQLAEFRKVLRKIIFAA